jgi:hypothetical protein
VALIKEKDVVERNIKNISQISWMLVMGLLLGACGGGTDNTDGNGVGHIDLSITDAPIDGAEQVVVEFTGVEIQSDLGRYTMNFASPKTIDLLALQGGQRELLLEDYELVEGTHAWIRLKVNAEADGVMDSYIRINGADYELRIPSGAQTGLKLNTPFTVNDGENLDFTIDFDLRKSVRQPRGQTFQGAPVYFLRPTLRLVDASEAGVIAGQIDPLVFNGLACSTPDLGYAVYLYEGAVSPDDMDGVDPDPITTAAVSLNATSNYVYTLAFVNPGDYTIAATCMADLDDAEADDAAVVFVGAASVAVTAGVTTTHDFQP